MYSCFPFVVADNLLIVNANFDNSVKDVNCEVDLFDKSGRELRKTIGEIQDNRLTVSFVVAPYDREYFVSIMCPGMREQYKSDLFSTSGGKTVIDLGKIVAISK